MNVGPGNILQMSCKWDVCTHRHESQYPRPERFPTLAQGRQICRLGPEECRGCPRALSTARKSPYLPTDTPRQDLIQDSRFHTEGGAEELQTYQQYLIAT